MTHHVNRLQGVRLQKDAKLMVRIPEINEFIEVQFSKDADKLVERNLESKIISESDLISPKDAESMVYQSDDTDFENLKGVIRGYAGRRNVEYIAILLDLPPLKQLPEKFPARMHLHPYNSK